MTARSSLNRLRIRVEKPAHFFQQCREFLRTPVAQVPGQNHVVPAFLQEVRSRNVLAGCGNAVILTPDS
jgi:hypothetical protein